MHDLTQLQEQPMLHYIVQGCRYDLFITKQRHYTLHVFGLEQANTGNILHINFIYTIISLYFISIHEETYIRLRMPLIPYKFPVLTHSTLDLLPNLVADFHYPWKVLQRLFRGCFHDCILFTSQHPKLLFITIFTFFNTFKQRCWILNRNIRKSFIDLSPIKKECSIFECQKVSTCHPYTSFLRHNTQVLAICQLLNDLNINTLLRYNYMIIKKIKKTNILIVIFNTPL